MIIDLPFRMLTLATDMVGLTGHRAPDQPSGSAHDFAFTSIRGEPMPLSDYAGRALLIANTASRCGFAPQFRGLQHLHETYGDRGLVVLGVPSNDFAGQEPGSADEIQSVCELNFGVTFPLTAKEHVTGTEAHPLFRWMSAQLGSMSAPRWNFYKYLIDPQGRVVDWFSPRTTPSAETFLRAVERILPEPSA